MMTPERKHFDPKAIGALDGVRVVDLSRLVAGNILTKVLADHGAEVVKVEPHDGDTLRAWRVNGVSTAWKTLSRNKKSVALKLREPDALAVVKRLVAGVASREAKLQTLIHAIPDLVWLKSPEGSYLGCNRAFDSFGKQ